MFVIYFLFFHWSNGKDNIHYDDFKSHNLDLNSREAYLSTLITGCGNNVTNHSKLIRLL